MIDQKHLKKEKFARRFVDAFSDFFSFSGQEVVFAAFLAASLTFLSTFSFLGYEEIQPPSPTDLPIVIEHFGFPFENLRNIHSYRPGKVPIHMSGQMQNVTIEIVDVELEWLGLMVNFMVYALPLIVIIKVIARVKDEIDYRKYDKK